MTRDELIEAITKATVELEVMVPSTDFYARGEPVKETIRVINPDALIEALGVSRLGAAL